MTWPEFPPRTTTSPLGPSSPLAPSLSAPSSRPTTPNRGGGSVVAMVLDLLRVEWSIAFIGVFIYILVITTYLLPIAEIGMGLALLGLLVSGRPFKFPAPAVAFLAFFTWCVLGLATAKYATVTSQKLIDFGKVGLIFLALLNAVVSLRQVRLMLVMFLTSFVMFPARGTIFNYFLYGNTVLGGRAAWRDMFSNANDMASLCLLPLALAIGYSLTTPSRIARWGAGVAIGLIGLALLLTQSRGGLIAFAVFLSLVLITQKRNRTRTIVVSIVLGAIVIVVAPGGAWERLSGLQKVSGSSDMQGVDKEGSAAERWTIWETAGRIINDNPVMGVGFGGYPEANARYSPHIGKRDTHSTYLNLMAETGVVGLGLFLGIFGVTIARARKLRRQLPDSLRQEGRRIALVEFALYGVFVAAIWGSYGKVALIYVHVAFLCVMTEALAKRRTAVVRAEHAARAAGGG